MLGLNRRNFMDDSQLESIHNYYEHLVFNQIATVSERAQEDTHFFADVACVALNQLPAKYVRHDVDMSFYMTAEEINQMLERVSLAVDHAIQFVENSGKSN